jgi:hypothetical protein
LPSGKLQTHRHALMTMTDYAFLQSRRLAQASREKRIAAGPPQPFLPAIGRTVVILARAARRYPIANARLRRASDLILKAALKTTSGAAG